MSTASDTRSRMPQTVAEAAIRTLRHDVGDLLQTVYAAAAILQQKLPADWDLERRILSDLRARAEGCRVVLDLAHDLICPVALDYEDVDVAELFAQQVSTVALRYSRLQVVQEVESSRNVLADPVRIAQMARLLLTDLCEAAATVVHARLRTATEGLGIEWSLTCDGPVPAPESLAQYSALGNPEHRGPPTLGRLLARRLVELHQGRLTARGTGQAGFTVEVVLPGTPESATL
jgi:signal transduction histidine kinase